METNVRYLGGVKFEAESRGHKVISDQPLEARGGDEGMTPPELLLSSLGTCAAFYAVYYLKYNGLPTEDLAVRVRSQKATAPARLDDFVIELEVPGVEASHLDGIRKAVEKCLVHATFVNSPSIRTEIKLGAALELQ